MRKDFGVALASHCQRMANYLMVLQYLSLAAQADKLQQHHLWLNTYIRCSTNLIALATFIDETLHRILAPMVSSWGGCTV